MVKHTRTESVALDVMMRRQQRDTGGVPRIDGALSAQARAAGCRAGNPVSAPRVRRNPDA
jgi:hypothetical protein